MGRGSTALLAISPHLDDAVLACGEALFSQPGAVVATLFAGSPARYGPVTPWDADAGFRTGQDVMAQRRAEDRAALAVLAAQPCWLGFLDRQYVEAPAQQDRGALEQAIRDLVDRLQPARVLIPLGLFHSDHTLASDAALATAANRADVRWTLYEDALYRRLPGVVQQRLHRFATLRWHVTPVDLPGGNLACKRAAVACYASQLRALNVEKRPGHMDAFARERYWDLASSRSLP
jgi:LmbE family N-acetylglucosaminyl deacetylase